MRFLIDECLSVRLVDTAYERGFEAHHVTRYGLSGVSDAKIVAIAVEEDLIVVTNNRDDYFSLIGKSEIHPGLIVIVPNVRRGEQIRLFRIALKVAASIDSTINKVIEVEEDGSVSVLDVPVQS